MLNGLAGKALNIDEVRTRDKKIKSAMILEPIPRGRESILSIKNQFSALIIDSSKEFESIRSS